MADIHESPEEVAVNTRNAEEEDIHKMVLAHLKEGLDSPTDHDEFEEVNFSRDDELDVLSILPLANPSNNADDASQETPKTMDIKHSNHSRGYNQEDKTIDNEDINNFSNFLPSSLTREPSIPRETRKTPDAVRCRNTQEIRDYWKSQETRVAQETQDFWDLWESKNVQQSWRSRDLGVFQDTLNVQNYRETRESQEQYEPRGIRQTWRTPTDIEAPAVSPPEMCNDNLTVKKIDDEKSKTQKY